LRDPIFKNPLKKERGAGGVTQDVGPEFKPQYRKKKSRYGLYRTVRSYCLRNIIKIHRIKSFSE
jgi:hypothetical protein